MYDIITIGDATIDMFLEIDEATVQCGLNKKRCVLELAYASKIPVTHTKRVVGVGNAANHAVGAKKLGLKSAMYTLVGDDDCGIDIRRALKRKGVNTDFVLADKGKETNYSTVINYKDDRTILVYHEERTYKLPKLPKTDWIYFSSIAGNHKEFNDALVRHVLQKKIRLGFNPGTMQMRLGVRKLKPVLEATDVLFVNKQEAERLVGEKKDMKKLLQAVRKKGPRVVAITNGQDGSYAYDGKAMYQIGIYDQPVIERTGSGDAYASGFLAALQYGESVQEAMRWGSLNASGVVQQVGSQAGLLTKKQIKTLLKEQSHFQPHEM